MMEQSISKKKKKWSVPRELPTQIILDILSRLPIKTLFDCQLVSKDWFSLISDPHFANLHLSRSPVSLLLKPKNRARQLLLLDLQILHKIHPREAQLKLNPKINFPHLGRDIVNSCNGLLCLCFSRSEIFVCNPILGEYITLPRTTYDGLDYGRTIIAFGFSPTTNQYKVLQFFHERVFDPFDLYSDDNFDLYTEFHAYRGEAKAKIYTIGEGSWRIIESVPFYLTNHSFNSSVNGALHWLTFTQDSPDFIRCFDFGSEEFRVVPEPIEFGLHKKEFPDHIRVGVLRDCLSICDFSSPLVIDIWVMKDYGIKESWSKEFAIENSIDKRGHLGSYEPIIILKSGEILMIVNNNALMLYNPKLGSFKKLNIYGVKSEFYGIAHIPSFVSLKDVAKGESLMHSHRSTTTVEGNHCCRTENYCTEWRGRLSDNYCTAVHHPNLMESTHTSPRDHSKAQRKGVVCSGPRVQGDPLHKANWDSASTKIFLELVIAEIHERNRPHCTLTTVGYKALAEKFHAVTGRLHDKKQLKNRYDSLKKDWIAWMKLMDNSKGITGVGYDHLTGLFTAPVRWWESMEAMNNRVAKFRTKSLDHIDLMEQVFFGASATGRRAWIPNEVDVGSADLSDSNGLTPFAFVEPAVDLMPQQPRSVDKMSQHVDGTSLFDDDDIFASTSKGKSKQKQRWSGTDSVATSMDNLMEVMRSQNREFRIVHGNANKTPTLAIQRLGTIPGITPGGPLYIFAVTLMDDAANLEILLNLPPEFVKNWLEMKMRQVDCK